MIPLSRWFRSRLFRSYLFQFPLIWLLVKAGNAYTAAWGGAPPLAFRPFTEVACCAIELFILWVFIRRNNEDILLGNLGLSWTVVLLPLVPVHVILSVAVALA
ncbi:MAG TPA: hypothetical protein VI159_10450 [Gemmatimonadales bacterium]